MVGLFVLDVWLIMKMRKPSIDTMIVEKSTRCKYSRSKCEYNASIATERDEETAKVTIS